MYIGSHTVHILHWTDRWETDFIDKPMKRWLQIATDDVDAHQVIGGGRRARCCNVKHRPPSCAMRINGCCCWTGCYGWTRPRTQLREDPRTTPSPPRDTWHPWRARTWTWTRSSCRSSAAWAPRTRTSLFRSSRGCWAFSSTLPAAPSSWTWPTGECGDWRARCGEDRSMTLT